MPSTPLVTKRTMKSCDYICLYFRHIYSVEKFEPVQLSNAVKFYRLCCKGVCSGVQIQRKYELSFSIKPIMIMLIIKSCSVLRTRTSTQACLLSLNNLNPIHVYLHRFNAVRVVEPAPEQMPYLHVKSASLMIMMIMKTCGFLSFKNRYSGISTQLKEFELVQVML